MNAQGVGTDYRGFYHFLEGLTDYEHWASRIDYTSKHRRLLPQESDWLRKDHILEAFQKLVERHQRSIIVISYRDDGIPSKDELIRLLKGYKATVHKASHAQKYALAKNASHEILLIAL